MKTGTGARPEWRAAVRGFQVIGMSTRSAINRTARAGGIPFVLALALVVVACETGPETYLSPPDTEGARSTPAQQYPTFNRLPNRPGQPKSREEVAEIERELEELREQQQD